MPEVKFEEQSLSSYSGLVVFQKFFDQIGLGERLRHSTRGSRHRGHYSMALLLKILIVHGLLGMRRLREIDGYRDDPMVQRVLGVKQLPSVPTVSRMLDGCESETVARVAACNTQMVLDRLASEKFTRVTLDFDGSVLATKRHAEGTAVGFNRARKGGRSYYPLFCTVAQTTQVLDVLHRSGNVHDSNGAIDFVRRCVQWVRKALPGVLVETRMDGAFFSEAMLGELEGLCVDYAVSVPFERFSVLKHIVQTRKRWRPLHSSARQSWFFESRWKPKSWRRRARFVFVRSEKSVRTAGALQLDLFEPRERDHEHKVIVTNKRSSARRVAHFIEGRGEQEGIFGELKNHGNLAYIPSRRRNANIVYLLCALMAHNLNRELQMRTWDPMRATTERRSPLWLFEKIESLRRNLIQRAGRFTRPAGRLVLTLNRNPTVEQYMRNYLAAA